MLDAVQGLAGAAFDRMPGMKIEVLFFASARDVAGRSSTTVDADEGAVVGQLVELLLARHPGLRPALGSVRFAVNEEFVDSGHELRPGDTLALLPPVSGG